MKAKQYRTVRIPKRNAKLTNKKLIQRKSNYPGPRSSLHNSSTRLLHIPSPQLAHCQRWILNNILYTQTISKWATAYAPGRSIRGNVEPHVKSRYFLCMDLANFFGSITFGKVASIFEYINYSTEVARLLTELCTVDNHLPQGGPSSAAISNLVMKPIDVSFEKLCAHGSGISYTRYADDMTFSSTSRSALRTLIPQIDSTVGSHGLAINWAKFHLVGPRRRCLALRGGI